MRLRWRRRIGKRLRGGGPRLAALRQAVRRLESQGQPVEKALRALMLDARAGHWDRAMAARLLQDAGNNGALQALLDLFLAQTGAEELLATALVLENLDDLRAVAPLKSALLSDENPYRRRAAAHALGWICAHGSRASKALARCLSNRGEVAEVRAEAAESLAYVGTRATTRALMEALGDGDCQVRFWAAFALGSPLRYEVDAEMVRALESKLDDEEGPEGWWPVGKEALAMLAEVEPPLEEHRRRLEAEISEAALNPDAPDWLRRWAEHYGGWAFSSSCR